jgi:SAM-dependent methyltransferase
MGRDDVTRTLGELDALGLRVPRGSALDFGCGVGRLTQALGEHFARVVGLDISAAMVERASAENRHAGRVKYMVNTARRPGLGVLGDARFDLVLSLISLQHNPTRVALAYIADFVRHLTPGGVAVFDLPHASLPGLWWRALRARLRRQPLMLLHGAPPDVVERVVIGAGGTVVSRREVNWSGSEIPSSVYYVRRSSGSPRARRRARAARRRA